MNKIAKCLLEIEAVKLDTNNLFTWASGIKSPIYTDNRLIMSFPKIRTIIEKELSNLIITKFPNVDFLMGTATAGIPHAAYVSTILNLPMGYIRSASKKHGKKNAIEGNLKAAKNVLVIEDLFSTGKSSLAAINILKAKNYNVIGVVSIFSYNLKVLKDNFAGIKYYSLVTINDLLDAAFKLDKLTKTDISKIEDFINKL